MTIIIKTSVTKIALRRLYFQNVSVCYINLKMSSFAEMYKTYLPTGGTVYCL